MRFGTLAGSCKLVCACRLLLLSTLARTLVTSQETPLLSVPKYSSGISHRTDFCPIHEAVEQGKIERRDALRGLDISVLFIQYQLNEEKGGIDEENPDIAIEILDKIAQDAGFTYRNTFGVVDSPTGNETWTDLLFWGVGVYDVMGEWFLETISRLAEGNVLYPEGWYDGSVILVMRQIKQKSTADLNFLSWTTPFTPGLWGLIAMTIVITGVVYYILDYFDSKIKGEEMDVCLEQSLFYAAFSFNGHVEHHPKSRGTRILIFSMSFFFLITVAAYTANLASFLVLRNQPNIVIESIQDVIRHDLTICVQGNSAADEHLQTYRIPQSKIYRGWGDDGAYVGLLEDRCDILLSTRGEFETFRRDEKLNPKCDLEFVGRVVKYQPAGFVVGDSEHYCTSLLRDVLHLYILEMKDSPTFELMWEKYREKAATTSCQIDSGGVFDKDAEKSMGIANLSGMFVLHVAALGVALASTLFKFCSQPREEKKKIISDLWRPSIVLGTRRTLDGSSCFSATSGWITKKSVTDDLESPPPTVEEGQHKTFTTKNSFEKEKIKSEPFWERLKETLAESNKHHREEMELKNRRHHQHMESLKDMLEETSQKHKEEIEQKNQWYQEELKQRNQQHKEEMKQTHKWYQDEMEHRYELQRQEMEKLWFSESLQKKEEFEPSSSAAQI